jgi:hypothetical protein
MNNHVNFLNEEVSKIRDNIYSRESLNRIHETMIDQHDAIKEALFDNIKNPVTYDTLPEVLGLPVDVEKVEE